MSLVGQDLYTLSVASRSIVYVVIWTAQHFFFGMNRCKAVLFSYADRFFTIAWFAALGCLFPLLAETAFCGHSFDWQLNMERHQACGLIKSVHSFAMIASVFWTASAAVVRCVSFMVLSLSLRIDCRLFTDIQSLSEESDDCKPILVYSRSLCQNFAVLSFWRDISRMYIRPLFRFGEWRARVSIFRVPLSHSLQFFFF